MKGPLTDVEKYAIDGMMADNVPLEEIKKALGRTPTSKVVEKYILSNTLEQGNPEFESIRAKDFFKSAQPEPLGYNVEYDHEAVLRKMAIAGIHGEDALRLIERALPKFKDRKAEVNEIYGEALRHVGPRELMVRASQGGDTGIAVMTEAAASRGERIAERVRPNQTEYVFNVKANPKK